MKVGLDVGSTTIKCVVLDDADHLIYSTYERHFSHILEKSDNRYSGIVDKHINLTETLKAHVKHFLYITVISHIAYKCFTDTAFFLNNGFDSI